MRDVRIHKRFGHGSLCFVDDEQSLGILVTQFDRKSEVIVVDAKTMSSDPVAVIEIPSRIPYGFHASFLTEVRKPAESMDALWF